MQQGVLVSVDANETSVWKSRSRSLTTFGASAFTLLAVLALAYQAPSAQRSTLLGYEGLSLHAIFKETEIHGYKRFGKDVGSNPQVLGALGHKGEGLADKKHVNKHKVVVKLYTESGCAMCSKYTTTYVKQLLAAPGVGEIVDFEIVPFGTTLVQRYATKKEMELNWKAPMTSLTTIPELKNLTKSFEAAYKLEQQLAPIPADIRPTPVKFECPHGFAECTANAWESCIQKVAPRHAQFFPVLDCIQQRACHEGESPPACVDTPRAVIEGCLADHGHHINTPELLQCYNSDEMFVLNLNNAVDTLQTAPAWLPWVTIDGQPLVTDTGSAVLSSEDAAKQPEFRKQFLLGKSVCEAYVKKTGDKAPVGCASMPQSDADVGTDPWLKFKTPDFSSLILKISKEKEKKAKAAKEQEEWMAQPWYVRNAKMMAVAIPIFGATSASTWYFMCRNKIDPAAYSSLDSA